MRVLSASVILFISLFLHLVYADGFRWSDCGVQLNKAIHYQSAAISPQNPKAGGPLSMNVRATIADTVYNANTRVMVWKDGDLYLDTYIDNLCDIISDTKGLSCPLYVGETSFTYEFSNVPTLPNGEYVIQVKSLIGMIGRTDNYEIGCVEFVGTVIGLAGSADSDDDNCKYNSHFEVRMSGNAAYTATDRKSRVVGDRIQIGPIGSLLTSPTYGGFVGSYTGTGDVGGEISTTNYNWAINGSLVSHNAPANSSRIVDMYAGSFYILYNNSINMRGIFNWTFDYDPNRQGPAPAEQVTGFITLDPKYYVLDQFTWPLTIGNLGPFQVRSLTDGTLLVEGAKQFCTCGEDACGVCGGNGKTCGMGNTNNNDDDWGPRKKAAVACGVIAFLLIVLVAELSRRVRKEKRRQPINDDDLLDHPEKPDYGTMAIDDAIREGERVTESERVV